MKNRIILWSKDILSDITAGDIMGVFLLLAMMFVADQLLRVSLWR